MHWNNFTINKIEDLTESIINFKKKLINQIQKNIRNY